VQLLGHRDHVSDLDTSQGRELAGFVTGVLPGTAPRLFLQNRRVLVRKTQALDDHMFGAGRGCRVDDLA
jgi:hypothetical protein